MFIKTISRLKHSCSTSDRRSSIDEVENVGTKSDPFMMVVIKCFPDSANSHVIQAAANLTIMIQGISNDTMTREEMIIGKIQCLI
jgi:hypothetical protein